MDTSSRAALLFKTAGDERAVLVGLDGSANELEHSGSSKLAHTLQPAARWLLGGAVTQVL